MYHRLMPPTDVAYQTIVANGRTYTSTPGNTLDVPDFDACVLEANHWTFIAMSGPTTDRPSGALGIHAAAKGVRYYDTTINALIEFDGGTWRDATGAAV